MRLLNEKARKEIIDFTKSSFEKIKPQAGVCRFNWQCHANAVHDATIENHDKIAMCIYISQNYPIVHFLNYNKEEKKFIDNTLGTWCYEYEYYLVRFIDKSEFNNIFAIHENYRKQLRKQLSFWTKLFSDYKG